MTLCNEVANEFCQVVGHQSTEMAEEHGKSATFSPEDATG